MNYEAGFAKYLADILNLSVLKVYDDKDKLLADFKLNSTAAPKKRAVISSVERVSTVKRTGKAVKFKIFYNGDHILSGSVGDDTMSFFPPDGLERAGMMYGDMAFALRCLHKGDSITLDYFELGI